MRNKRKEKIKKIKEIKREQSKLTVAVYLILRIAVVFTMIAQFFSGNYENVFMCILTLVLFMLPSIVERRFDLDLPNGLEIIVLLFIFAAQILGEIREFYLLIPYWDTILHTINGFMAAAIGFAMVDILNEKEKVSLSLSPFFMAVVAFCFSMTIGVIWEFFEFSMDYFFAFDMQKDTIISTINSVTLNPEGKNIVEGIHGITDTILVTQEGNISLGVGGYLEIGLFDTMEDMFVNFIGAVIFSVIGYFYVKSRGKSKLLSELIMKRRKKTEGDGENDFNSGE